MNGKKVRQEHSHHLLPPFAGFWDLCFTQTLLLSQPSPSILNDLAKHSPWVNSCGFTWAYFQSQDMIQQGV